MNKQRLIDTLLTLVQINSESGDERLIADYLLKELKSLGIDVEEDSSQIETGYGAGNLFATIEGSKNAEPICFMVHMDTVKPGNNVKPIVDDTYIKSDGTTILGADDKAGIAALIETIRVLKEKNIEHGDIEIIITVGEETGLIGAKALDTSKIKSKFGYAIDAPGLVGTVVTQAPTQSKIDVDIYGKTAHAGVAPEKGVSAIEIAGRAIANMKLGRIDDETTANIGKITGGETTNVVTEHVELKAEARSLVMDKLTAQVDHMRTVFQETAEAMGGSVTFEERNVYAPINVAPDREVVTTVVEAINNIGRTPDLVSLGGGSDGNIFSEKGIETIILGLGYEEIHTKQERMPISELISITELVIELIQVQAKKEK